MRASGTIEATQVDLAPKVPGRILHLKVRDGDRVLKNQVIAVLDGTEQSYAYQQAVANVGALRARLAQARAVLRQQTAVQEASEGQALAARRGTQVRIPQAGLTTELQRTTVFPQWREAQEQLDSSVAGERSAQAAVRAAQAALRSAEVALIRAHADSQRYQQLYSDGFATSQELEQALAAELSAAAAADAADAQLGSTRAEASAALHARRQARSALAVAQANLASVRLRQFDFVANRYADAQALETLRLTKANRLQLQALQRAVEAAVASLRQGEAQLRQARANRDYTVLRAPFRGMVLTHSVEVGDLVATGTTVVTLGDLDHPYLRVFVSERDVGRVRLGQRAEVRIDAYPQRIFAGRVDEIRDRAEYTLGNVQTQEERVKLVFGVRVLLDNPDWALKPGLPADAFLRTGPS